jgi:outer membrane protein assembly factor BamE (lipoprotein component of BamABCDE complex)
MQGNEFRAGLVPVVAACALLALGACQARIDNRGYLPDEDEVARIKPGVQGRDEVRDILGTPSSASTFTSDRWYYISKKTSQRAFFDPKVLDQKVLEIDFDGNGLVQDVKNYTLQDGQKIEPVARITPSPGRELTFTEQLIGNIGKFNSPQGSTTGNPNRPQGPGY